MGCHGCATIESRLVERAVGIGGFVVCACMFTTGPRAWMARMMGDGFSTCGDRVVLVSAAVVGM